MTKLRFLIWPAASHLAHTWLRSFCRSTEPITSFRYRLFADETKPELPLREASGSLSIDLNLDHEPRKLLSSIPSRETSLPSLPTSLTVNCELLVTELQWRFSAPLNQRSPQSPRSIVGWVGRGSRSSRCPIVVVVSLFLLLGRCVAQRSTRRRWFWVIRSRFASPRASRWSARPVR